MKPFNLEEAKAGKKVVTRDGSTVKITSFEGSHRQPISATIYHTSPVAICDVAYPVSGSFFESGSKHHLDLFMADDEPKQESSELQAWCREILPIVQAAANGEEIEIFNYCGEWFTKTMLGFDECNKYRIKPKVKTVNGFEVPMHEAVAPAVNETYYTPDIHNKSYNVMCWYGDSDDHRFLTSGIVYLDKESAAKCAKAMLGINPEGDE